MDNYYMSKVKGFLYMGSLINIPGLSMIPDWITFAYQAGTLFYDVNGNLYLKTIGGSIPVNKGDCIVSDPQSVLSVRKLEE